MHNEYSIENNRKILKIKGELINPPFSFYMYVSDKLFINWFYLKDFVFNTVNHFSCHDTLITLCHV